MWNKSTFYDSALRFDCCIWYIMLKHSSLNFIGVLISVFNKILIGNKLPKLMSSQPPENMPARYLSLCHGKHWVAPSIRGQKDPWCNLNWANSRTSPANPGIPPNLEWPGTEPTASAVTSMSVTTVRVCRHESCSYGSDK